MTFEARKLHVIEEILKVKSDAILIEIEAVLRKGSKSNQAKFSKK